MSNGIGLATLLLTLSLTSCAKKPSEDQQKSAPTAATPAPAAVAPSPASEARTLFRARCAVCHGDSGKGDGAGAAALNPKPRDYTDASWQDSVSDEQIQKTIVQGGAAVGKSPTMPGNPDLASKEAVVAELVKLIRAFKSK
jgi:cytochrome c553